MAVEAPPSVDALPAAPDPNNRATFNILAYPWAAALATLRTQLVALAANMFGNATDAATSAGTATTQAGIATDKAVEAAGSANTASSAAGTATAAAIAAAGSAATIGTAAAFVDSNSVVKGSADATKQVRFEVDGLTTATTRVLTVPDRDGTIPLEAKGANIASAATVNLDTATGDLVHITGEAAITGITLASGLSSDVVFDGALTLTHNATTLILPGGANIATAAGDRATFRGDGTGNVRCMHFTKASGAPTVASGAGDHYVTVTTGNGSGSTNTKVRRFTTTEGSAGTAITYADSATLGASFTINEDGLYNLYYLDSSSAGSCFIGASKNSAQLTTNLFSITASTRPMISFVDMGAPVAVSNVVRLVAGDVIRPHHGNSAPNSTDPALSVFTIRKVGV